MSAEYFRPYPKIEQAPPRERAVIDLDAWKRRGAKKYAEKKAAEAIRRMEAGEYVEGIRPINPERRAKLREEQFAISSGYHAWVIQQPCAACGSVSEGGSDPAHVGKTRGAGAKAEHVLSLCHPCHLWEGEHRDEFNEIFAERHGVTPEDMAFYRFEMFHRDGGSAA